LRLILFARHKVAVLQQGANERRLAQSRGACLGCGGGGVLVYFWFGDSGCFFFFEAKKNKELERKQQVHVPATIRLYVVAFFTRLSADALFSQGR